jgi:hypothetical protein
MGVIDAEPLRQFGLSWQHCCFGWACCGGGYVGWLMELHFEDVSEGWVFRIFSVGGEVLG